MSYPSSQTEGTSHLWEGCAEYSDQDVGSEEPETRVPLRQPPVHFLACMGSGHIPGVPTAGWLHKEL